MSGVVGRGQRDRAPKTGDTMICSRCQFIMIFERTGNRITLRRPTWDELTEIGDDELVMKTRQILEMIETLEADQ